MKTIRIGSGAGFAGDRIEPAVELMEKGNLDYIIFECLAERTVAIGQQDKINDPDTGYNQSLKQRMERILPLAKQNKIKVITNMGSANPKAAAEMTSEIANQLSIKGLKIAYVTGDDIFLVIEKYFNHEILETGKKLETLKESIVSANVYMGSESILEALEEGADIIITGRVSDPALTIAPLVYEFGWNLEENPDQMGQAVLAGHILECAGQVTGGYFADPGYKDIPDLERLGFPLLEVNETGEFIVTKVEGSGGKVCVETCKEQTIYEIHNPKAYLTPDATADFSKVKFTEIGKNRVMAQQATSHGKPDLLKVTIAYKDCFIGEGEISYGGSNSMKRAELAADIVEKRLKIIGLEVEELRIDFIGYNSLYKNQISNQITTLSIPEVRLRITGRTKDKYNADILANEVETLYTNGPAGGGGVTKKVQEITSICSIFIPRKDAKTLVEYMEV